MVGITACSLTSQLSPLFEVGIVGVEMLTGDVLKQTRSTHLATSEFVDIIIKSVPYLTTEKYRLSVFDDGYFQIGAAVLLQ